MKNIQTILAIDDKKENLDILLDILDEYDVIPSTSGFKAIETAKKEDISLILLDIVMPEIDGFEVCKILKTDIQTKEIPIIFTTAKTDEDSIAKAYSAGANDYVSKPLKKAEVLARVETQLRLKKTLDDLEFLASRDFMTGIYNRRKFFEIAKSEFEKSESDIFVSMIDIDFFKKVNDIFGHDAGDAVIKLVTKTVSDMLPKNSIFARLGGEEFVAMCINISKDEIIDLFNNIRNKISTLILNYNGHKISFTISNGISKRTDLTKSVDELLKEADLALYEAKNSGRNRVVFR